MGELAASGASAARARVRRLRSHVLAWVEQESFTILLVAVCGIALLYRLRYELFQDGWLTLLGGRIVAQHGLPHHDTLTIWAHGATWIDQQWLGQLTFYGLFALGGIKLALLVNVALITGAFAAAVAAARWRGASPVRVAVVAALCLPVVAFSWQLRSQSLAYLLFVAVLWLLVRDARAPTSLVFLTLPLLALWANLHGSVVLGALLVALRAATLAVQEALARRPVRNWLPRTVALFLGPGLCIFASPYGFDLAGYYQRTLLNPSFAKYVVEWHPTLPGGATAPFYVVAFAALWLMGRARCLALFERLLLIVTVAAAVSSLRDVVWFGLTAVVVLPRALEEAWPSRAEAPQRQQLNVLVALGAVAASLVLAAVVAARPLSWLRRDWSPEASAAVAHQATADPSLRVLATARYADWLLFEEPQLAGRVAFDARLELLSQTQVRRFFELVNAIGDRWREATAGYGLLVVDPDRESDLQRVLLAEPGVHPLYRDKRITILVRRG